MADINTRETPFLLIEKVVIGANSTGTIAFTISKSEAYSVIELWFKSTGTFDIVGVKDQSSTPYSNASLSNPIPSSMLPLNAGTSLPQPLTLSNELVLQEGTRLFVEVKDTSGSSNSVYLFLNCRRLIK